MLPVPSASRLLLFLLIYRVLSIEERDFDNLNDDYLGVAEIDGPAVPTTEDPSHLHEEMTKLEKYLAKKTQSSTILPDKRVRMHLSPHVENVFLNEQAQTLYISMRTCMFWFDPRIRWNPKDFDGHTHAFLHNWEVWSPHLESLDSATPLYSDVQYSRIQAKRMNDDFYYLYKCPGMHTTVDCIVDAAKFPHDRQRCDVVLEDRTYSRMFDLDFVLNNNQGREAEMNSPFTQFINRTHYGPWQLLNMTYRVMTRDNMNRVHELTDKRTSDRLVHIISVVLEREGTFFTTTFLIPGLLFLSITATAFMCSNRWLTLQLLSMNLLLLALFITSSYKRFPIHYSNTPRIVAFWQFEIMFTSFQWTLCVCLMVYKNYKRGKEASVAEQPPTDDEDFITTDCVIKKFFSLSNIFFILSVLVGFVLLMPSSESEYGILTYRGLQKQLYG